MKRSNLFLVIAIIVMVFSSCGSGNRNRSHVAGVYSNIDSTNVDASKFVTNDSLYYVELEKITDLNKYNCSLILRTFNPRTVLVTPNNKLLVVKEDSELYEYLIKNYSVGKNVKYRD